jgi:hypothetical protein
MINLTIRVGTEDVGVFEVDGGVSDGVTGVDKGFSLAVELDGVAGFVDAIGFDNVGFLGHLFHDHTNVLFVQIFDVVDGVAR